ncbi:ALF repeat-containing protein [Streptomyces sp. NPDC059851]|uniref:ALF repeat-containing protein n=1 Tax=Streptomyces sp. NPDC059851 TaxID=3346971 RepID=UPI0036592083
MPLTAGLLIGGATLGTMTPAWAVAPLPAASAAADQPADQPSSIAAAASGAARESVLRVATSSLPAELRVSAWNALRSTRGDEAISEWLAPGGGYDLAKQRLRDTRTRNRLFCERVVRTHTVEFSPEVRSAAERALKGSDADRVAFVKTGYAEAQQRDRSVRDAATQHRQEVSARDRDFVRRTAESDPGEQVRVAAQWALRPGAADTDVTEFFGYGWMTGGALDLEAYRLRAADDDTLRHYTLTQLLKEAVAAEAALKGAADGARARAEAQQAWKAVAEHADAARGAWSAGQATATAQAESWRDIADAARGSADELWKRIAEPAAANQGSWTKEHADAAKAVTFWQEMFARAHESEMRVKD